MAYSFKPEYLFTKGIVYGEFFDPATDHLLGFSQYMTEFALSSSLNNGEVEGGPGNMLVMCIPDSARLSITAKTADAALNNVALAIGTSLTGNGIVETMKSVTASNTTLSLTGAVAPYGGVNGAVAYVLTSSGSDKSTVEANSGHAYTVSNGTISGFTAVSGNTYCVKYFIQNSSAEKMSISALFAPKVVRAHFAVNCYAKSKGSDVMSSSIYKIRHYYFPYYYFTAGLSDTASQTATGTVDLSGNALTYEEAMSNGVCTDANQRYGYIVDEYVDGSSTASVDGIYFIGMGSGVSVAAGATLNLPVKYSVNGQLAEITDMSSVTFTSSDATKASFASSHDGTITGVAAGSATATVSVTNSRTGVTYTDTIAVTVTSA